LLRIEDGESLEAT